MEGDSRLHLCAGAHFSEPVTSVASSVAEGMPSCRPALGVAGVAFLFADEALGLPLSALSPLPVVGVDVSW